MTATSHIYGQISDALFGGRVSAHRQSALYFKVDAKNAIESHLGK